MSFFGKNFKKIKVENLVELLDKIKCEGSGCSKHHDHALSWAGFNDVGAKGFDLLNQTNTLNTYTANDDGSIQFVVTLGDRIIMSQRIAHNKEGQFVSPDGVLIKTVSYIEGNVVKTTLKFPEGKEVNLDRYFNENTMKMEVSIPGVDIKGIIYYRAV